MGSALASPVCLFVLVKRRENEKRETDQRGTEKGIDGFACLSYGREDRWMERVEQIEYVKSRTRRGLSGCMPLTFISSPTPPPLFSRTPILCMLASPCVRISRIVKHTIPVLLTVDVEVS